MFITPFLFVYCYLVFFPNIITIGTMNSSVAQGGITGEKLHLRPLCLGAAVVNVLQIFTTIECAQANGGNVCRDLNAFQVRAVAEDSFADGSNRIGDYDIFQT